MREGGGTIIQQTAARTEEKQNKETRRKQLENTSQFLFFGVSRVNSLFLSLLSKTATSLRCMFPYSLLGSFTGAHHWCEP